MHFPSPRLRHHPGWPGPSLGRVLGGGRDLRPRRDPGLQALLRRLQPGLRGEALPGDGRQRHDKHD